VLVVFNIFDLNIFDLFDLFKLPNIPIFELFLDGVVAFLENGNKLLGTAFDIVFSVEVVALLSAPIAELIADVVVEGKVFVANSEIELNAEFNAFDVVEGRVLVAKSETELSAEFVALKALFAVLPILSNTLSDIV
jgi:hypothetical protein